MKNNKLFKLLFMLKEGLENNPNAQLIGPVLLSMTLKDISDEDIKEISVCKELGKEIMEEAKKEMSSRKAMQELMKSIKGNVIRQTLVIPKEVMDKICEYKRKALEDDKNIHIEHIGDGENIKITISVPASNVIKTMEGCACEIVHLIPLIKFIEKN